MEVLQFCYQQKGVPFNVNIKQKAAERIKRLSEKLGCDKYNLKKTDKRTCAVSAFPCRRACGLSLFFAADSCIRGLNMRAKPSDTFPRVSAKEVLNAPRLQGLGDGITPCRLHHLPCKICKSDSISDVSSLCDNIVSVSSDLSQGSGFSSTVSLPPSAPQGPLENLLDQLPTTTPSRWTKNCALLQLYRICRRTL